MENSIAHYWLKKIEKQFLAKNKESISGEYFMTNSTTPNQKKLGQYGKRK